MKTGILSTKAKAAISVTVSAIFLLFMHLNPHLGVVGLVTFIVALFIIPTSAQIGPRLVINISLAFAFIYFLYLIPAWKTPLTPTSIVLFAGLAGTVFSLIPAGTCAPKESKQQRPDLVLLCVAAGLGFFIMSPFWVGAILGKSVTLLVEYLGIDAVGHFTMFGNIHKFATTGIFWPTAPDGSDLVYAPYPQAFHVIADFFASFFDINRVSNPDQWPGLYLLGVTFAVAIGFVLAQAAILSILNLWKNSVALKVLASIPLWAGMSIGLGFSAFGYGFHNYYFAILCCISGVVFSFYRVKKSALSVYALVSISLIAASSWLLIASMVSTAALVYVIQSFKDRTSEVRRTWLSLFTGIVLPLALLTIGLYLPTQLSAKATSVAGGLLGALSVPGASPTSSPVNTLLFAMVLILLLAVGNKLLPSRISQDISLFTPLLAVLSGTVCVVAILLYEKITRISAAYYLQKTTMGLSLVALAVSGIIFAIGFASITAFSKPKRILSSILLWVLLIVPSAYISFVSTNNPQALETVPFGLRSWLHANSASRDDKNKQISELILGSGEMASWPCQRPVLLASNSPGLPTYEYNSWASALSLTWSESSAPINRDLYYNFPNLTEENAVTAAESILKKFPTTCIVLAEKFRPLFQESPLSSRIRFTG